MRLKIIGIFLCILIGSSVSAQDWNKKIVNWYNGKKMGMHTDLAYKKLLNDKNPEPVIVAVIDSGVDIEHEDLKGHIWTNEEEIPNNGIDDDKNGYIDDVHGWNFLGNADGEIVNEEQLEVTRLFAKYDEQFKGRSAEDITADEKPFFNLYKEVKKEVEKNQKECQRNMEDFEKDLERFRKADKVIKDQVGGAYSFKDVKKLTKDPAFESEAVSIMTMWLYGFDSLEDYEDAYNYWRISLAYNYNTAFNAREIIGDDPSNFGDSGYGNNNVRGLGAEHGTHVAGIICGIRGNKKGGDGVSDAALIMHPDHIHASIRCETVNTKYYEGDMNSNSELLITNIKEIKA